ncbi:coiled-coil domain-containing protein [Ditylenchus destructor]|uniref:Coiled-coil domain-containing protein n=1 Tax=Ditylenchus destructor TaxID=166010 RepID=A0AAD4NHJ1_9BILA|nr:coiled-coil domain-containing protein [Ditylenchus destructor]
MPGPSSLHTPTGSTRLQRRFDEVDEDDEEEQNSPITNNLLVNIPAEIASQLNRYHTEPHARHLSSDNRSSLSSGSRGFLTPGESENLFARAVSRSQNIDWDLCEIVRIQELNETRQRAAQMENTMRWWSQCTAAWRDKWNNVRNERNRAREDANRLRLTLQETREEIERLHLAKEKSESEARILARQCRRQLLNPSGSSNQAQHAEGNAIKTQVNQIHADATTQTENVFPDEQATLLGQSQISTTLNTNIKSVVKNKGEKLSSFDDHTNAMEIPEKPESAMTNPPKPEDVHRQTAFNENATPGQANLSIALKNQQKTEISYSNSSFPRIAVRRRNTLN